MELLLNLCWLLIAASALCAWGRRRDVVAARSHLIALICLLALLFPVISATDDLHAMRPEIEDSASNRRSLKAVTADKAASLNAFHCPPALPVVAADVFPWGIEARLPNSAESIRRLIDSRLVENGRAPPVANLA